MTQLIITILALVLIAAIVVASLDLLPIGSKIRVDAITKTQQDVESLRRGVEAYLEDLRDPLTGAIVLPEPTSTLMAELAPTYVFRPRGIQGGTWAAGIAERDSRDQFYFCLSPPADGWASDARQGLLDAIANRFPEQAAVLNASCGATQHQPGNGDRLTYWYPPIRTIAEQAGVAIIEPPPSPLDVRILDEDRPVNFRVTLDATATSAFNQVTPARVEVFLEIRNPEANLSWTMIDKWSPSVGINYDRTISASWQGIPVSVSTTINEASTTVSKTGSVSGTVPAGWEVRYTAVVTGDAAVTTLRAVAHRM